MDKSLCSLGGVVLMLGCAAGRGNSEPTANAPGPVAPPALVTPRTSSATEPADAGSESPLAATPPLPYGCNDLLSVSHEKLIIVWADLGVRPEQPGYADKRQAVLDVLPEGNVIAREQSGLVRLDLNLDGLKAVCNSRLPLTVIDSRRIQPDG